MTRSLLPLVLLGLAACSRAPAPVQSPPAAIPTIASFTATATALTVGRPTQLTAVFSGGEGRILPDVGAVESGAVVSVSPAATTQYELDVSAGSTTATRSLSIEVVPAPEMPVVEVSSPVFSGMLTVARVQAQDGMTYAWSLTGGDIVAGQGGPSVAFRAGPPGSDSLACIVTNAAGDSASSATSFEVVLDVPADEIGEIDVMHGASEGDTLHAHLQVPDGVSVAWTIFGGTITSPATGPDVDFTAGPRSLELTATVMLPDGTTLQRTALVGVAARPDPGNILAPAMVSTGDTIQVSVRGQPDMLYTWVVEGGTVVAGPGTSEISVQAGAVGTLDLTCAVSNAVGLVVKVTGTASIVQQVVAVTNTNDQGPGSLRAGFELAAIAEHKVDLVWQASGTEVVLESPIVPTGKVTFHGSGSTALTIRRGEHYVGTSFFDLQPGVAPEVELQGVRLYGGDAGGAYGGQRSSGGGGAGLGGAIRMASGKLVLRDVAFEYNQANGGFGDIDVGALPRDASEAMGGGGGCADERGLDSTALLPGEGGYILWNSPFMQSAGGQGGLVGGDGGVGGFSCGGGGGGWALTGGVPGKGGDGGFGGGGGGGGGLLAFGVGSAQGGKGGQFGGDGIGLGGGGGAGLGGALFVISDLPAAEVVFDGVDFRDNGAYGGIGGAGNFPRTNQGQGKGGAMFIGGSTKTSGGNTVTFERNRATDSAGIPGDNDDVYGMLSP